MTGRITFKSGRDDTRNGDLIALVPMAPADWKKIEAATGALSDDDQKEIIRICEESRYLAKLEPPNRPDIKATLAAITRLSDDGKIFAALEDCDEPSRASIEAALYKMDGANFQAPRPAKIRAGAWLALQDLPKSTGGAPVKEWRKTLAGEITIFCDKRQIQKAAPQLLEAVIWVVDPGKPPEDRSVAIKLIGAARKLLRKVIA